MRQPLRKEQRHAHILRVAQKLFETRGYEEITIADVIAESNIARGTFYLHFASLEVLLAALFEEAVADTWRRIAPILDDLSIPFETCTVEVVHAVFRMFGDENSLGSVYYSGGGQVFLQKKQEAMFGTLGDMLVQALEKRHARSIQNLQWTVAMLISLVGEMSYYASKYVDIVHRDTFKQMLTEFVLAGLRKHFESILVADGPTDSSDKTAVDAAHL